MPDKSASNAFTLTNPKRKMNDDAHNDPPLWPALERLDQLLTPPEGVDATEIDSQKFGAMSTRLLRRRSHPITTAHRPSTRGPLA